MYDRIFVLIHIIGSFIYIVISSAVKDILISSFPMCIPLISFSWLTALAETLSTILNRCGKSEQPCLAHDFGEIVLSFSTYKLMMTIYFLKISYIILKLVSYIVNLWRPFNMKVCSILSKIFFILWDDHVV